MNRLPSLHARRSATALALAALTFVAACGFDDDDDDTGGGSCSTNPTAPGCGTPTVLTGTITQNTTLNANTKYTLSGFVKVNPGVTLTIPAGTLLVGDTTQTSALFVLRGGKINALGTASAPIVMTSARAAGNRAPGDWGGLILVGNGVINRSGAVILEGTSTRPADAVNYGQGTDNADNSGTLSYVRVEFAGYAEAQNAELNAFTFAAVGRGTTLDHLEALAGLDDSFEWFGGNVDSKYLVSYESGDDHFDAAEGFQGRNQFLIGYQTTRLAPRAGAIGGLSTDPQGFEIDGCDTGATGCNNGQAATPYTVPIFANFTMVGTGPNVVPANTGIALLVRRGAAGRWVNGVIARWPIGFALRDQETLNRLTNDSLAVRNVLFAENGAVFDPAASNLGTAARFTTAAFDSSATNAAALFTALPAAATAPTTATLDWSLTANAAARTGGLTPFTGTLAAQAGSVVSATAYRGAADPNASTKWWAGWTSYARN